MKKLRYAVVGVGGFGGYYGGRLANAGCDVHFLFHSDFAFAKENGLTVDSVCGSFRLTKIQVYASSAEMPVCDIVLVCLKTTNNHLLPEILRPLLHEKTHIVLIQNGLDIERQLQEAFPENPVLGGLAFICSFRIGPAHIKHLDYGTLTIGAYSANTDADIVRQFADDLQTSGVPCKLADNLNEARWRKLVWNIPYNGLTVILNTTTDLLMKGRQTHALIRDLMCETIEAGNSCGVKIPLSFADEMLQATDAMKPYSPSMKLDFDNRRALEIQAIYSNPIAVARQNGFDMKKTAVLEEQLHFIQQQILKN